MSQSHADSRNGIKSAKQALKQGRWSDALVHLEPLLGRNGAPADDRIYLLLAKAYIGLGRFDDVDAMIARAAEERPTNDALAEEYRSIRAAQCLPWEARSLFNVARYTKRGNNVSAGLRFPSGYHSLDLGPVKIPGAKDPMERIRDLPIDFSGVSVLDIGCNQGGMLFALADQLRWGVGIDIDPAMINTCNKQRSYRRAHNLDFYLHDVADHPFQLLHHLLPEERVDVVLFLQLWLDDVPSVLQRLARICRTLVFEPIWHREDAWEAVDSLSGIFADVQAIESAAFCQIHQRPHTMYCCRSPREDLIV